MIARIDNHPTDPDAVLVQTPPDIAHTMGRFALARYSRKATAYIVAVEDLDKLRTFLRTQAGCTLVDERSDTGVKHPRGPLPECRSCGAPASRKASLRLNRCTTCGDAWHPVTQTEGPGIDMPRIECTGCGHTQRLGGKFCGDCGALMPDPEPRDLEGHVAAARQAATSRTVLQDPLPVAAAIPEHIQAELDARVYRPEPEEEPERERYP